MKKILTTLLFLVPIIIFSQNFTRQDTLRGSITPQRAWWDLTYYHLDSKSGGINFKIHGFDFEGLGNKF